jgi:uncharacterized protein (DUF433 family)
MDISIATTELPMQKDAHSAVIRVGRTRITLETVLKAFKNGATCEEIIYQYPSLELADVYIVVGYYLRNQAKVEIYLQERQKNADEIRNKIKNHFDSQGIRNRLLKRRHAKNG